MAFMILCLSNHLYSRFFSVLKLSRNCQISRVLNTLVPKKATYSFLRDNLWPTAYWQL